MALPFLSGISLGLLTHGSSTAFQQYEMTLPRGEPVRYLKQLIDNMPANRVSDPYNGPRPTRFERILEDD